MKRTMIFCLSLVLGLATMMAQDTKQCPKGEGQQCSKLTTEQKAQLITDRMAKAYDLTAEQKAKLLELNTKALTPRHHKAAPCPKDGDHKCDKAKQDCNKPCPEGGEKKCDKPATCPMDGAKKCAPGPGGYFKALAEIMTPEQFAAYRADKMIERQLMPRRPQMRGRFGHRGMPGPGFGGGKGMQHRGHGPGMKGQPGAPAQGECAQGGDHQCAKGGEHKDCAKAGSKECKHDMKGCEKGGKECSPCKCAGKCGKKSCKKCKACKK
ncbi:MAG: DUF4890 domain-containing protein [Bacteroidaceae bacterium]|nr:DUF4890 domain-containing protein [Bacteroidaceae bacterium]